MHTNYIREETRIRHFTVLRSTGWCNPREGGWGVKDRALTAVKQHQQQGIQSLRVQNCKSKKNLGQDFTTVVLCFVVTVGNLAKCVITFICGWLVSCKEELDYASISKDSYFRPNDDGMWTKVVVTCSGILKHWCFANAFTVPFAWLPVLLLCCFHLSFGRWSVLCLTCIDVHSV